VSFHFANTAAFQLLGLAAILLAFALWRLSRGRALFIKTFGAARVSFLAQSISWPKRRWKIILQCLSLAVMIVAMARPQSGESRAKAKSEGLEIMLVMDVSSSMLADDVRPSRLDLMKQESFRLLDQLGSDKIGLVAFAGSAILLSPLTTDKSALKMYIDSLSPNSVATQGTEFSKALAEAEAALKRGGLDADADADAAVTKVIVMISDGENHDQKDLDIITRIAGEGIHVYTMAVGTEKGAPIPLRDDHGNLLGYKKSRDGQVVMSQSTGKSLEKLALAGHGTFRFLTFGGSAIGALINDMNTLQRSQFETMEVTNYQENYQIILIWAVLFALLEMFLGERKGEGRVWRGRFEALRK
jgi:Ca-activated chloride channel family protein